MLLRSEPPLGRRMLGQHAEDGLGLVAAHRRQQRLYRHELRARGWSQDKNEGE